ncbi:MAG: hypothetical protein WBV67_14605, partial [Candidatus Cybelea sp.]
MGHRLLRAAALSAAASIIAACSATPSVPAVPGVAFSATLQQLSGTGAGKIKHVVYIVQENRSFDDLFHGYPGADTVSSGKNTMGQTIKLQPIPLSRGYEIDHSGQA